MTCQFPNKNFHAGNILLVEDASADRWLISRALQAIDPKIALVHVKDGREAISYIDGCHPLEGPPPHPCPDLVLLDINLAGNSGFTVLSWIRQDPRPLRDIPIVILSGSDRSEDKARAYAFGANGYIHKPSTSTELQTALQQVVAF